MHTNYLFSFFYPFFLVVFSFHALFINFFIRVNMSGESSTRLPIWLTCSFRTDWFVCVFVGCYFCLVVFLVFLWFTTLFAVLFDYFLSSLSNCLSIVGIRLQYVYSFSDQARCYLQILFTFFRLVFSTTCYMSVKMCFTFRVAYTPQGLPCFSISILSSIYLLLFPPPSSFSYLSLSRRVYL